MIYLDNNATTRVADEVLDAMDPYYRALYGNPHSSHTLGRRAHAGVQQARAEVATLLHVRPEEVFFTSCGTEGNAIVIRGLAGSSKRRRIVSTSVEHPSVLTLLRELEREGTIELVLAGVDGDGRIDLDQMEALINDATLLVSVMLAQNETGVLHPVKEIAVIAASHGALVQVDAVQATGKIAVDCQELGADFVTISGHKFHAPKGVGALVIRNGCKVRPLWYGGGQEAGLRSGTEAVPSIVGLGKASTMAAAFLPRYDQVSSLRDHFEQSVLRAVDDTSVNGAGPSRLGNTANISFAGRYADELVRAFDGRGICASAGAACDSGRVEPTGTMKAMGKPLHEAMGAVRFSLSRYTTGEEITEAIGVIADVCRN